MGGISQQDLLNQIEKLDAEYSALRIEAKYEDLSDLPRESQVLAIRLRAALHRFDLLNSVYSADIERVKKYRTHAQIPVYIDILRALKADIDEGWAAGVAELVHADTFADLLDQASELLRKGYKDAAAVVTGSVLESHIRLLCQKVDVSTQQSPGQAKKADTMNADLVKAGAYNGLQQKSVTAWLGVRNAAAHGEYSKFDATHVAGLIEGVKAFIRQHPA